MDVSLFFVSLLMFPYFCVHDEADEAGLFFALLSEILGQEEYSPEIPL